MDASPYRDGYRDDLRLNTDESPGGIMLYYADGDERIIHVNQYVVDLFECDSVDDFLDLTKGSFRNMVYEADLESSEESIWGQVGKRNGFDHIYYRIQTKTGRLVSVDDYGRLIEHYEDGRPVFQVFLVRMTRESSVDWLTGLPSMTRFHELARMGVAGIVAHGGTPAAVAFDIIGMKGYNTRHGRHQGDILLRAVADKLRACFGSEACSRYGEDHYYAYAPADEVEDKVNRFFTSMEEGARHRMPPVRAGVYVCDPDDDIVEVGFDRAKAACDLDRTSWKSCLRWFTDDMRASARLRLHVLEHLDQALEEGWVRPYYQAVVRASTGQVCGEEALARWHDPEYGALSPAQFVPVLEEAGLLHKLDMHMLDCVLADMHRKRDCDVPVTPVSLNISLRDLGNVDIAHAATVRADAAGIPHDLLRIEFTESAVMHDADYLRAQMRALHDAGFQVWMDDFGSGYSSLNSLQEFEFDLIKLDMGFLRGSNQDKARVIIEGVVQAAGKLGVSTLAEGVETEEQALFLEGVGCDILQGFYYAKPQPLDKIIERLRETGADKHEDYVEAPYWDAVSVLSLTDLMARSSDDADWVPMTEFPVGVVERRGDTWRLLRSNRSFDAFLDEAGLVPRSHSNLRAITLATHVDEELHAVAERADASGTWQRVPGHMDLGSGFLFYLRLVAQTNDARAYMVAAVPTLLGAGLGSYGDVPVAYAVFRVVLDESGDAVRDTEYVYANEQYLQMCGMERMELAGQSFLSVAPNADAMWFPYCYRAAVLGETVHDVVYSPEVGHWLSFNLAPTPIEGCCVYAFTIVDDEQHEHEELVVGRNTNELIISIVGALSGEARYDVAMRQLLDTMSGIIHPERLYVYERGERTTSNTFEWCAPGVEPQMETLQNIDNDEFEVWDEYLTHDDVVLISDVEELREVDERMYRELRRQGITHMLAVPLYGDGEFMGYMGADNYMLEEGLDTMRLLQTVAPFVGSRMASRRLLDELEYVGMHDELTGLLNRRGIDQAIDKCLREGSHGTWSLALMDVDDFKTLNDVYGHDVGDEALRALARVVEAAFPDGAVVGRNGGDEFLAMLCGDDAARMVSIVRDLCAMSLSCEHEGRHYDLSLSIGFVDYPGQATSLKDMYSKADAALYAVKLAGKDGYRRYSEGMKLKSQNRSWLGFAPRDVAEHIPGAILVHLPGDDQILFANDELVKLFECDDLSDFMEYTGGTYGGIICPEDRQRVHDELAVQMTLDDVGQKDHVSFRIRTKQGQERTVLNIGRLVEVANVGQVFYELIIE